MFIKRRMLFIVLCLNLLLIGCSDQEIIGQLNYVTVLAIDKNESTDKQKNIFTAFVTDYQQRAGQLMSIEEKSKIGAINKLDKRSERRLVTGQMRMVLFGEELSRDGVKDHLIMLDRHPDIKSRLMLLVVEGEAKEALQFLVKQKKDGDYIGKILDKYYETNTAPEINICTFSRELLDDGKDPFMPLISVEGKEVHWKGTALFKGDTYIQSINSDETNLLLILMGTFNDGRLEIFIEDGETGLSDIRTKQHIKVQSSEGKKPLTIHISIKLNAYLVDFNGQLNINEKTDDLEKEIERKFMEGANNLLIKLQDNNVDPIGLGRFVRNHVGFNEWMNSNWDEIYQDIEIIPQFEVKLSHTGRLQ